MSERWSVSTREGFLRWYDASVGATRRYAGRLCGPDRELAEDLVHDVYLHLLEQSRDGRVSEATIGLATTAVRHRFLDHLRRVEAEERRSRLVGVDTWVDPGDDPTDGLPPRERAALVLRYVDGCSVPEVAEHLGTTVHAAESLLMRAKARARKEVGDHG